MTIFGIEIVLTDAIIALVCLVGVMIALIGGRRCYFVKCLGLAIVALGVCLMLYVTGGGWG